MRFCYHKFDNFSDFYYCSRLSPIVVLVHFFMLKFSFKNDKKANYFYAIIFLLCLYTVELSPPQLPLLVQLESMDNLS